jgi:apolipoprotein D and lipocalin family protein
MRGSSRFRVHHRTIVVFLAGNAGELFRAGDCHRARSMKYVFLLVCLGLLAGCATPSGAPSLRTVRHVDLNRYMGDWYVIAHIPYFAEKGKVATMDRYSLRPDGKVDSLFLFHQGAFDAPQKHWHAVAEVVNHETNAEWRLQFVWPIKLAYLIVALDPDYRWALVGCSSRNYLWVLARDRTISNELYKTILRRAAAQGYDITRVVQVPQIQASSRK